MPNEILTHNMCRLIAQTYAIELSAVVAQFEIIRSIDKILDLIEEGKLK